MASDVAAASRAREDARVAFFDAVRRAVVALGTADDDEPSANDARAASTERDDAATLSRAASAARALAATANALAVADDVAGSVSELEDEDGAMAKLERASASAASAAETFRTLASEDGARARAMIGERGQLTCDAVRDAAWGGLRARLAASGWPPGLRPTELRAYGWSLARDGGEDDDADAALGELRAVRAFHVLRTTSEARAAFAGEASFAHDDVALAFVEDLAEALRVTFATRGSLSDPRKPERLFACAKELTIKTPMLVRAELDRAVFVDEPKIAVATTRHYLSLLLHAVSDVIRTHVCVACAASEEPWWLHVADECRAFDDHVSRNPYADVEETPKVLDALVCEQAHAEAWLDAECEHARVRASKSWNEAKNWAASAGDGDVEYKAPYVAQVVVEETKNAFESAKGLSRADWRLYFVNRVAIPVLDEFIDECECRAVGSKGLGSLVAATGSWRSGTEGTAVIGAAVNASTFVARALRVLAEDTFVLEFGGEKCLETYASKFEKFTTRWIDAVADAAASQFTDKVLGDAYVGSTHLQAYETLGDEDARDASDDGSSRNVSASGYMLAALAPLRDRVDDARAAFGVAAFEKCWRAIASKTTRVIVDRIVCVATFSRAGAKQLERDRDAHANVFVECAKRPSALRAKTKTLAECVSALSCDGPTARELIEALRSDGMKGLAVVNARKSSLDVTALDDASLLRVLHRRRDVVDGDAVA